MKLAEIHINSSVYLLAICLTIFVIISWYISPFIPDDSYISFRYAENLAQNKGLTFNPGEAPVEGYSSLLWILFCTLISLAGLDIPSFAPVIGITLGILCIIVLWFILRQRGLSTLQQIIPLLLLSCSGPFILYSVSGMETPLFSLLLLMGLLCFDFISKTKNPFWLNALCIISFLLTLCRPEGVIFYLLFITIIVVKHRLNPIFFKASFNNWLIFNFIIFTFFMIIYELWRIGYFGEYLPTPFISKGVMGSSVLSIWATNLKFYFLSQSNHFAPIGYYYFALMILALSAILHAYFTKKYFPFFETGTLLMSLAFAFIYMNFYDWMPGMRYYAPITVLFLVACIQLFQRIPIKNSKLLATDTLNFATILILMLTVNFSFVAELRRDAIRLEESTQRSMVYLGKWLKINVPTNTLLAVSDVGAIPYYSGLPTLDFNPKSLTDIYIVKNGWSNNYILKRKPGIVIFVSSSLVEPKFYGQHIELFNDPRFSLQYRLVGKTRIGWYGDRSYWTYAHNSVTLTNTQLSTLPQGIGH